MTSPLVLTHAGLHACLALDMLYAFLPALACQGKCQASCGPILMTRIEWQRIVERLGYTPAGTPSLVCPMLNRGTGRCLVYDLRPMICRLWGLVETMPCPWGCKPSRVLSRLEGFDWLARAVVLGLGIS